MNIFKVDCDLHVRSDTIKLLEEKLCDIELGKDFSGMTPKAQATKAKTEKRDHIRLKSLCAAKEAINRGKKQPKK